jgi:phenylalanyl-tRNA synthetase beta chain
LPVVALEAHRFSKLVGAPRGRILDRLPYIGLDIESVEPNRIRVEYSPNRPDFGTDYGIAKALRGLLGLEVGLKGYPTRASGVSVSVDPRLASVRPFIACATVDALDLDEEDIRQLISLQEDLHNGLGRRRKMVAIGLHDAASLVPPMRYQAVDASFEFVPLGEADPMRIDRILEETETGRSFGWILEGKKHFPLITDSKGTVLSFPPIINGTSTRLSASTKRVFIDVTSVERDLGDDVLAVLTTTLADMGGKVGTVRIDYGRSARVTPDLAPSRIALDQTLINQITGLGLSRKEMVECLRKSRLDAKGASVLIPRYRIDILHQVDIAEEVALGYGIDAIGAEYPPSKRPGSFNAWESILDRVADIAAESGMIELMNTELVSEPTLYGNFGRSPSAQIRVEGPRTLEHSILRDSVLPSLMQALSRNVKEPYPQRVFEIGRVYLRTRDGVEEAWHLGCLTAHSSSSFTEAKTYLEAICRTLVGVSAETDPAEHWAFAPGRCAAVSIKGKALGHLGEVEPAAVASFGLDVPVAGFEVDLSRFL